MSGHSHWAGIKHRKGINDAKRGKIFTKHGKLITIATRQGGGDPEMNFQLRLAIDRARLENMPKENIERAVKRGTGELKDGAEIEEVIYEAYSADNVAMLIKTATDNKNRTFSELRTIFNRLGGKMVPSGSVGFLFRQVDAINITASEKDISDFEMEAIEAGALDISHQEGVMTVFTKTENFQAIKENLEKKGMKIESAGLIYLPLQKIDLNQNSRLNYEKLLEALDDQDDVDEVYDNL